MLSSRLIATLAGLAVLGFACAADAADHLRIAIQKTGTVGWEIAIIKARGLDKAAGLEIETTELATTDAGKLAISSGGADMIVSDWLWVARERALGDKLLFTPYSTALGAIMVAKDSPIHGLADLDGKSLGVAGGPIDKSWLLAQALARRSGLDLAKRARISYGAPPLIAEKLAEGESEAALEFWNFCAGLEARGFRRAIEMSDIETALGAEGPVAMTGYVFREDFAAAHKDALKRYFAAAAQAREILAHETQAWGPIKAQLRLADDAALEAYRRRYLEGVPKRSLAAQAADAGKLYKILAETGGRELVGPAPDLDQALFYDPTHSE